MIDEIRKTVHIQEFVAKQRAVRRYNSKVIPRDMKEGDLVLRQVVAPTKIGKLFPNVECSQPAPLLQLVTYHCLKGRAQ